MAWTTVSQQSLLSSFRSRARIFFHPLKAQMYFIVFEDIGSVGREKKYFDSSGILRRHSSIDSSLGIVVDNDILPNRLGVGCGCAARSQTKSTNSIAIVCSILFAESNSVVQSQSDISCSFATLSISIMNVFVRPTSVRHRPKGREWNLFPRWALSAELSKYFLGRFIKNHLQILQVCSFAVQGSTNWWLSLYTQIVYTFCYFFCVHSCAASRLILSN